MEQIIQFFQQYGVLGLFILSFLESFISPILPEVLLIPMSVANPEEAIYYALVTTLASILGGILGYWLGIKLGLPMAKKIIPQQYLTIIDKWIKKYGGWTVFILAMAPIPYKFISISAGVFKIKPATFLLASVLGRTKRFLPLGILIFYYGPKAVQAMHNGWDNYLLWMLGGLVVLVVAVVLFKQVISKKLQQEDEKG